ncbi:MAG: PhzF family phenazine biosynthesis protein [Theionarchaea archaeon]|nr:PhzF family phenazine biosynthesis protein [Theionarchaea archaeon]
MKTLKMKKAHVFAEELYGGNPAGIVFLEEPLSSEEMKLISQIINPISETVFISVSEKADHKFRFFTHLSEIEICGHATIGACFALCGDQGKGKKILNIETKMGIFPVTLYFEAGTLLKVMMKQGTPEFGDTIKDPEILVQILGMSLKDLDRLLPIQVVSTGRPKLIVPVVTKRVLNDLNPDFAKMIAFLDEIKATGIHVFTFETEDRNSLVHSRHFAPTVGVNEDPATGNSNAALGAYLYNYGRLDSEEFTAEQGYAMGRPSRLFVRVDETGVYVGGSAAMVLEGSVTI